LRQCEEVDLLHVELSPEEIEKQKAKEARRAENERKRAED